VRRRTAAGWLWLVVPVVVLAAGTQAQEPELPPAPEASEVVGPPRGQPLSGPELDARTDEVAGLLRCPVCQGLSVGDSPAGMAQKMKLQVRELVAAGYDEEQILNYFERSYGEFVRLEPPLRGVNWIVWLAPLGGLLLGSAVVFWTLRGSGRTTAAQTAPGEELDDAEARPDPDRLPEDEALACYVLKVREEAYGWPGGVSASREEPS
jgi:cytochrome c-type biogenesis protein CcmH